MLQPCMNILSHQHLNLAGLAVRCLSASSLFGSPQHRFQSSGRSKILDQPRSALFMNIERHCLLHKSSRRYLGRVAVEFREVKNAESRFGKLVYEGPLNKIVFAVKSFSLSTSVLTLALQPALFYNYYPTVEPSGAGLAGILAATVMSGFVFVTPLLLHLISRKYVSRIFFDASSKTFTAMTWDVFLREAAYQFTPDMVRYSQGAFSYVVVGDKPLFFVPDSFKDREALKILLSLDKKGDDWNAYFDKTGDGGVNQNQNARKVK